ncbi:MAG: type I secretion system permease/ATPase [Pseudomonadota bacterium]
MRHRVEHLTQLSQAPLAALSQGCEMDSGLHALAMAARLHHLAVEPGQLQQRFAPTEGSCSVIDVVRAARAIGLKAQRVRLTPGELSAELLPALARDGEGRFLLLARQLAEPDSTTFLVQRAEAKSPERVTAQDLVDAGCEELILLRPKRRLGDASQGFNLRWFVPALYKYRRLLAEVVVASFFIQIFALLTPLFFQVVMDKVLVHQGYTTLNVLAIGFAALLVFEAIIGGLRSYVFSHTTARVDVELGARLFSHLARLPLAWFENRQVGQTVARVHELDSLRQFLTGSALTLLVDLSFTFIFFAVLWYYSPSLTWIVVASLPCYVLLSVAITPSLRRRIDERFRASARNQAFLTEAVGGIETLKSQALEPQLQRRWEDQLADQVASTFRAQNLSNIAGQGAGLISKATTLGIIWWGAQLVIAGQLTVGQLVAFNMIAGRISGPILKLVQLWQELQQAGLSLRRLGDILNAPAEPSFSAGRSVPERISGAVQFEKLRFRYQTDGPIVLDNLDLTVKAGEVVGLVGRSGSGKSTLAKLLQRLYVPEAGHVRLDGMDLAVLDSQWLRRQVGVIQQESVLFSRSVRDNIALSEPGAPLERVMRCAKAAGAHRFILDLPKGYDTEVGERGCNLSGGQRQRIAIARALLTDPAILIFDEATSALDYESERVIQENMGAMAAGRTVFIIAHRLSTVRHCDRILVLDGGRVLEQGEHSDLLAQDGYYAKLYSYQNHSPAIRQVGSAR